MAQFQDHHANMDWNKLEALFKLAGLNGRVGDKIRRAFINSSVTIFAFDDGVLIGACRAMTDFEYHAFIYDVVVHPHYQRQGIGSQMLKLLLDRLQVWRIMLVSDGNTDGFYRQFGFEPHGYVMASLDRQYLHD